MLFAVRADLIDEAGINSFDQITASTVYLLPLIIHNCIKELLNNKTTRAKSKSFEYR